jgi:uncharacterized protein (DUF2267 family)
MTTEDTLLAQIERQGLSSEQAGMALRATLEALGAALVENERCAVSATLPAALRQSFDTRAHLPDLDLEGFFQRVRRHERTPAGRSREHAQIVCRALSEALPAEVVVLLTKHVPWLVPLFESPGKTAPPDEPERFQGPSRPPTFDGTLARGRPGSRHPLSDSRPERAHPESVVRSEEPHADTKLSSAHGFTQEREHETLATGRPGAKRPLSG